MARRAAHGRPRRPRGARDPDRADGPSERGREPDLDAVRAEFERFADQSRAANERAAEALEGVLRANFADGDGRLPRTLETFLGDRGKLKGMVEELFDP